MNGTDCARRSEATHGCDMRCNTTSWNSCAPTNTRPSTGKNACGCLFTRKTDQTKESSDEYIGTGDYLRHLTSSIIGTPDVIYEVSYECGPYHAGGERKGGGRSKTKKGKNEVHPKGMKDKNDVYDSINHGEVL